jgi:hypothetical protein
LAEKPEQIYDLRLTIYERGKLFLPRKSVVAAEALRRLQPILISGHTVILSIVLFDMFRLPDWALFAKARPV